MNAKPPDSSGHPGVDPGVDMDLLADYASGALDGTRESENVARRVASDPAWADALADLRQADALVRADLAALGRTPTHLPDDVAARLERTLRDTTPSVVVPLARHRRRRRLAIASAAAAAVVALAGPVGYVVSGSGPGGISEGRSTTESSRDAAGRDAATALDREPGHRAGSAGGWPVPVLASGTDYGRGTVASVRSRSQPVMGNTPPRVSGDLARLADPDALAACLAALRSRYPGVVSLVDFARFEGAPALIVALRERSGTARVVVAGPDCGRTGVDERYTVTV